MYTWIITWKGLGPEGQLYTVPVKADRLADIFDKAIVMLGSLYSQRIVKVELMDGETMK